MGLDYTNLQRVKALFQPKIEMRPVYMDQFIELEGISLNPRATRLRISSAITSCQSKRARAQN